MSPAAIYGTSMAWPRPLWVDWRSAMDQGKQSAPLYGGRQTANQQLYARRMAGDKTPEPRSGWRHRVPTDHASLDAFDCFATYGRDFVVL